jgi:hypothetical protein
LLRVDVLNLELEKLKPSDPNRAASKFLNYHSLCHPPVPTIGVISRWQEGEGEAEAIVRQGALL